MALLGLLATMVRAGIIAPLRPDKYVRIAAVARREGLSVTSGFAMSAQRCPNRPAIIDEIGALTFGELDRRCHALAAALQALPGGAPQVVGVMCRNHRGFVEALVAANRIGADVLLLNTSFAGPALAEVVTREGAEAVIYDEEFTDSVDRALAQKPDATRIVAWAEDPERHERTVEKLIGAHAGQRPTQAERTGRLILLTSGTTGTPKGAKHSG
ncbi:MAG: AMP-binding protein, partial [Mycobacterium sp.]